MVPREETCACSGNFGSYWSGFDVRCHAGREFVKRTSNPKLHWNQYFASGPLILTFANVPAEKGCECRNRTTSPRQNRGMATTEDRAKLAQTIREARHAHQTLPAAIRRQGSAAVLCHPRRRSTFRLRHSRLRRQGRPARDVRGAVRQR